MSAAFGEEASGGIPYGRYDGSAIGSSAESEPFGVSLYVAKGKEAGTTEVTAVTAKLPIPVSASGVAQAVPGGWDIPVSKSWDAIDLSGSGVARLRQRGGQWVVFGEGSGSYKGNSGSGTAYGVLTTTTVSPGEQVSEALTGFLSFGANKTTQISTPEKYNQAEFEKPAAVAAPVANDAEGSEKTPPDWRVEAFVIIIVAAAAFFFVAL
jgi:hypothetical protein